MKRGKQGRKVTKSTEAYSRPPQGNPAYTNIDFLVPRCYFFLNLYIGKKVPGGPKKQKQLNGNSHSTAFVFFWTTR